MSANSEVHAAITLLGAALDAHIEQVMKPHLDGLKWPAVLEVLDKDKGRGDYTYSCHDVALQLRMVTERLGSLGFPFDVGDKNRTMSAYGSVLRIVRKRWAHNDEFSTFDALAAIETVRTVLAHIGDVERVKEVAGLRAKIVSDLLKEEEPTVGAEPASETTQSPPKSGSDSPGEAFTGSSPGDWGRTRLVPWEPWEVAVVGEQDDLESFRSKRVKELVRSLIEDIVDAEGPVHRERLGRLVGYGFGFTRVQDKRLARILGQIKHAAVEEDGEAFIWPKNVDRAKWLICRVAPRGGRRLEEISPVELANGFVEVAGQTGNMAESEARQRVLALFGRTRNSKQATAQLGHALSKGEQWGRLRVEDKRVTCL